MKSAIKKSGDYNNLRISRWKSKKQDGGERLIVVRSRGTRRLCSGTPARRRLMAMQSDAPISYSRAYQSCRICLSAAVDSCAFVPDKFYTGIYSIKEDKRHYDDSDEVVNKN